MKDDGGSCSREGELKLMEMEMEGGFLHGSLGRVIAKREEREGEIGWDGTHARHVIGAGVFCFWVLLYFILFFLISLLFGQGRK